MKERPRGRDDEWKDGDGSAGYGGKWSNYSIKLNSMKRDFCQQRTRKGRQAVGLTSPRKIDLDLVEGEYSALRLIKWNGMDGFANSVCQC